MKKKITMLLMAGLFPVCMLSAQSGLPMKVVGEMRVAEGADMLSQGELRVDIASFGSGHITNHGTLNLPNGITFVSDAVTDGTLLNDGDGIVDFTGASQSDVKVVKEFTVGAYSYVSFPFDVKVGEIHNEDAGTTLTFNTNFFIGYYDSQRRADVGLIAESDGANWIWIGNTAAGYDGPADPKDYILKAGVGYLVMPTTPAGIMRLVFPAYAGINDIYSSVGDHYKKVDLTYYNSTNHTIDTQFGWNFIGNTQTTNFRLDGTHLDGTGFDGGFYYYEAGSWSFFHPWMASPDDKATMSPYAAKFAHAAEDIHVGYLSTGRHLEHQSGISFRTSSQNNKFANHLKLALNFEDNESLENMLYIVSNDDYSKGFKIVEDAISMTTESDPKSAFYSLLDGERMSLNGLPFSVTEIPLGASIKTEGNYSIVLDQLVGYDDKHILLYDKASNAIQDMLENDTYTFYSSTGVLDNRFELRISNDFTSIPDTETSNIYVYTEDNNVFIQNISAGDRVYIYDAAGALISNKIASSSEMSTSITGKGVFIVKVVGNIPFTTKVLLK